MDQDNKGQGHSTLTKKRYAEIEEHIRQFVDNSVADKIMDTIKSVMNFNPDKPVYSPQHAERMKKYRAKLKELGIPRSDRRPIPSVAVQ